MTMTIINTGHNYGNSHFVANFDFFPPPPKIAKYYSNILNKSFVCVTPEAVSEVANVKLFLRKHASRPPLLSRGVDTILKVGGLYDNCVHSMEIFFNLLIFLQFRLAKFCCFQPLKVNSISTKLS